MLKRKESGAMLILLLVILMPSVNIPKFRTISEAAAQGASVPSFVAQNALVYESGSAFQWLDPHVSYYEYDFWVLRHSVETLLGYNKSSSTDIIPWLAENWTMISETCYELKLRQGITFQDGTPFNATAVWFSLNRLLILDGTSPGGVHGSQAAWMVQQLVDPYGSLFTAMGADPSYDESWVNDVLNLNFVEIVDNYTVRLHLVRPTSQLFAILSHPCAGIISPSETIRKDYEYNGWSQQPLNFTKYFVHMAGWGETYFNLPEDGWTFGTGPYYVESVDATTYKIVMKAYINYWGGPNDMNLPPTGKQRIQTIEFVYQPSLTTRLLDLRQGTATAISVADADIYSVVDKDAWIDQGILKSIIDDVTVRGPISTLNTWWLNFCTNVTNPEGSFKSWQPFADWRFRMAIACSVNMTYANIYINNRLGVLASTIIPPGTFPDGSYNPDVKPTFSFDLNRAEDLLRDAFEHPRNSTDYTMHYYNGTQIPAGMVNNKFGPDNPQIVEFYVGSGATTFMQILTTMRDNLNAIANSITGTPSALQFHVVIVPAGHQYTLASRHQIDAYMGGWIADYNHVMDWLMPMYYSRSTYPRWNQWNVSALDNLYLQAVETDEAGNRTKLVEVSDQMNGMANELLMYMVWWHDAEFFVRSSWLKGWYVNPAYGVDIWSAMYYETPAAEEWSFAIITDLHIGRGYPDYGGGGWNDAGTSGQNYYLTERLSNTVKWIKENRVRYNIKFVVVLGDIADSGEYSELEKAKSILDDLDKSDVPYVPVIGNHDVWPHTEDEEADYPESDLHFRKIFIEDRLDVLRSHFENWDSPLITQEVEWGVGPWKKEWTAYLQNYAFSYNGVKFIALDCVARVPFLGVGPGVGPDAVLWDRTLDWLGENLHESQPTVLFSHHPFVPDMVLAFQNDEMEKLTETISDSKAKVLANFAGHIHGYYDPGEPWLPGVKNPIFMDANKNYTSLGYSTPAGITVETTEALMVASNEPINKSIVRLVQMNNGEIVNDTVDGEFRALNPYFKVDVETRPAPTWPPWKWVIEVEAYSFTKRFSDENLGTYSLYVDDIRVGTAQSKNWDSGVQFELDYEGDKYYAFNLTVKGYTPDGLQEIMESINQTLYLHRPKLIVGAFCPVNITVKDPDGFTISHESNEIVGATYTEDDFNGDGSNDDLVTISDRKIGDYLITVIPEASAAPTDTYTLYVFGREETIVLADNVSISDVPTQPYVVESTETGVSQRVTFSAVWDSVNYPVVISSNSTVTNSIFNQSLMQIGFEVSGETGTRGYCNVTLPKTLLKGEPWTVKINGTDWDLTTSDNATHNFIYFTYTHASTLQIVIQGTWVIPELPSILILPLLMMLSTIAIVSTKKKNQKL